MKPSKIFDVMDLTLRARLKGEIFNPLFVGAPGIGKSQVIQQWCRRNDMPFIDLRAALLEAPDIIGFPSIVTRNGRSITTHNIPEFWPHEGRGVLILEEPNRGTSSVMNTFMQLLTDRKIHTYPFPEEWLIAGAINPEGAEYDVNVMDSALKNRFDIFEIEYDKLTFLEYMQSADWDRAVTLFVETGAWNYVKPEDIGDAPGAKYISPRTFGKLNAALKAGFNNEEDEIMVYEAVLGKIIGRQFFNFKHNEQPVTYADLVNHTQSALAKLNKFCDPNNYKTGYISITIRDIVEVNDITDELLTQVMRVLPADQGYTMLRDLEFKRKDEGITRRICKADKKVLEKLRAVLKT